MSDNQTRAGAGVVVLSTTPQSGIRAVWVAADGDMAVTFADGTHNNANPVAVTAGQLFPFQVTHTTAANTATLLGIK